MAPPHHAVTGSKRGQPTDPVKAEAVLALWVNEQMSYSRIEKTIGVNARTAGKIVQRAQVQAGEGKSTSLKKLAN